MGNAVRCISAEDRLKGKATGLKKPSPSPSSSAPSSSSFSAVKKKKKPTVSFADDQLDSNLASLSEHALAAALLYQRNNGNSLSRSRSVAHPSPGSKKPAGFSRKSSSTRERSPSDSLLMRPNQDLKGSDLETNHFVLVHGGGFGAWCWYKTINLLEESGFKVDAVDLTGSGIHYSDTNSIRTLAEYVKPLFNIFDKLGEGDKVILVGHDLGGACISYLMELFPSKIAKAVFIAATMVCNGQSALDLFSQQTGSSDMENQSHNFIYANGNNEPPTAIDIDRTLLADLWFNRSSSKDVALASVSMRPIPFAPVAEKLSLSSNNYGSIPRFYIKTQEDCAMSGDLQESMIISNPPTQAFHLNGSDHAPFFSKPKGLHKILVKISHISS